MFHPFMKMLTEVGRDFKSTDDVDRKHREVRRVHLIVAQFRDALLRATMVANVVAIEYIEETG